MRLRGWLFRKQRVRVWVKCPHGIFMVQHCHMDGLPHRWGCERCDLKVIVTAPAPGGDGTLGAEPAPQDGAPKWHFTTTYPKAHYFVPGISTDTKPGEPGSLEWCNICGEGADPGGDGT